MIRRTLAAMLIFFVLMFFGAGIYGWLFSHTFGGGVQESYLYPIYGGLILLAGLIVACSCYICNKLDDIKKHIDRES